MITPNRKGNRDELGFGSQKKKKLLLWTEVTIKWQTRRRDEGQRPELGNVNLLFQIQKLSRIQILKSNPKVIHLY